jgi:hypothetical protein
MRGSLPAVGVAFPTGHTISANEHEVRRPDASSSCRSTPCMGVARGLAKTATRSGSAGEATPSRDGATLRRRLFSGRLLAVAHLESQSRHSLRRHGAVAAGRYLNRPEQLPQSPSSLRSPAAMESLPRSCSSPKASTFFGTLRGSGSRLLPSGRSSSPSSFPRRPGGRCSRRSPHPAASP